MEVDKGFSKVFAQALNSGAPLTAAAPKIVTDFDSPSQRKDGNNVILQDELMAMGKNSAEYEALGEFVSYSMRTLRMAITGRSNA
jgi:flagellar basal body rod protein FlgB